MVVTNGEATGFKILVALSAVDGVHKIVPALPLPCNCTDDPESMLEPGPALTVTAGFTVTVNDLVVTQVPILAVTV